MRFEGQLFTIVWGDASGSVKVPSLDAYRQGAALEGGVWDRIRRDTIGLQRFFFAHQVHGVQGYEVTQELIQRNYPWTLPGDYLITRVPGIGIGVLTADCLPIVLYDMRHHACSIIHAGWKSSVAGIVTKAVGHMRVVFGTVPEDLQVFFGPCAGTCCYNVGPELLEAVKNDAKLVTEVRQDQTYFDLIGYNRLLLGRAGVALKQCNFQAHACTICNSRFCSYRREKEAAARQITIICLHT